MRRASACPHDCPSTCALEVEVLDRNTIGRLYGAADNSYTSGVICAKVARYAERVHHKDRLTQALVRTGPKGSGAFEPIGIEEALDRVAERFLDIERRLGPETVWPYYYAGTMGLVMRDGINRLRHVKRYSDQYSTICTALSWAGYMAGHGRMTGTDPREIAESDCVVLWGTNAVVTQVNVMTHAVRARKERGAPIVAVDVYDNADDAPGRRADPAAARHRRRAGLRRHARAVPRRLRGPRLYGPLRRRSRRDSRPICATRTPEWASAICGVPAEEIEALCASPGRAGGRVVSSASATGSPARATAPPRCMR